MMLTGLRNTKPNLKWRISFFTWKGEWIYSFGNHTRNWKKYHVQGHVSKCFLQQQLSENKHCKMNTAAEEWKLFGGRSQRKCLINVSYMFKNNDQKPPRKLLAIWNFFFPRRHIVLVQVAKIRYQKLGVIKGTEVISQSSGGWEV